MATKKSGAKRPAPKQRAASALTSKPEKLVALTVKVDHDFYVRLCTVGATLRRTNQDILYEAVKQYIDKAEA